MGKFQKRIESRKRIEAVKDEFEEVIEDLIDQNQDLTMNEIATALLNMLLEWNEKERKKNIS